MSDAGGVETGSCTNAISQGDIAKQVHPNAGGRRISNAHLTNAQHTTTFGYAVIHQRGADLYRMVELLVRHCWLIKEIPSAAGYLAVDDAFDSRQVVVDAYINDAQRKAMLATEHIHSPTPGEVDHLLPSDFTGRHTDAFALDTMITTQKQVTRMGQRRRQRLLNETHLQG